MNNGRNISAVAKYIGLSVLQKGLEVSPLKLQKLLYYAQAWHAVFFKKENLLFEDQPQAWVNGPVYPAVFAQYRYKNMRDPLSERDFTVEKDVEGELKRLAKELSFSNDEVACLDSIITLYGAKSQDELVAITHSERPWAEARAGLLPFEASNNVISLDTMYDYYKTRYQNNRKQ